MEHLAIIHRKYTDESSFPSDRCCVQEPDNWAFWYFSIFISSPIKKYQITSSHYVGNFLRELEGIQVRVCVKECSKDDSAGFLKIQLIYIMRRGNFENSSCQLLGPRCCFKGSKDLQLLLLDFRWKNCWKKFFWEDWMNGALSPKLSYKTSKNRK